MKRDCQASKGFDKRIGGDVGFIGDLIEPLLPNIHILADGYTL